MRRKLPLWFIELIAWGAVALPFLILAAFGFGVGALLWRWLG